MTSIENLRKFHNMIKNDLILSAASNFTEPTLMDIAVGRGGDMFKWKNAGIKLVFGFDSHSFSIKEAILRLKSVLKTQKNLPFIKYYTLDMFDKDIIKKIHEREKNIKGLYTEYGINKYDIISCQFAFHYFCQTEEILNNTLNTISIKLKKGGYFIGTATDGDKIENLDTHFENSTLQISKIDKNCYTFNISSDSKKTYFDIKGKSTEFLLKKSVFISTAEKYGLSPVSINEFENYYDSNFSLTPDEQLISFLNFSFIFIKK